MIERLYDVEDFIRLAKERKIPLKLVRLGFWDEVKEGMGRREAILSLPYRDRYLEMDIVMECLVGYCYYNWFFYQEELNRKEEDRETQKLREWEKKVLDYVQEKLGFKPTFGRWFP